MAEGFARAYGSDVLEPESAGVAPAISIAPLTHKVMLEKNIDLGHAYPKSMQMLKGGFDLIVNMSGRDLPDDVGAPVEEWIVQDPIGMSEQTYREVRDQIEQRVMRLVLAARSRKPPQSEEGQVAGPPRVDTRRHPPRQ
jgi:arsenate reductase (thioredoxin)